MRGGSNSTSIPRLNVRRRIPVRNRRPDVPVECSAVMRPRGPRPGGREAWGVPDEPGVSDLADLVEAQLDRDVALEDRQEDRELLVLRADLLDGRGVALERALLHEHRLAHLELDDVLGVVAHVALERAGLLRDLRLLLLEDGAQHLE